MTALGRRTVLAMVAAVLAGAQVARAADSVSNPTVTGPVSGGTHGQPFGALSASDLSSAPSTETEYFFAGTANAYEKDGALGVDGVWNVKPAKMADYKIRMVVRR